MSSSDAWHVKSSGCRSLSEEREEERKNSAKTDFLEKLLSRSQINFAPWLRLATGMKRVKGTDLLRAPTCAPSPGCPVERVARNA